MSPDPAPSFVPYKQRWFDDYPVGEIAEFGDHTVTEAEIVDFATRYDPQPFHVDAQAAKSSNFGGLIASGWMTASCAMRMLVDHYISPQASMGSPGIDELRWVQPVRPGDRLRMRTTVLESRRSQSKPDRGMIRFHWDVLRQDGVSVMTMTGWGMYRTRPAG
ncbi:MAG: MaoC family dehydratase [Burkholderiales bacterium]